MFKNRLFDILMALAFVAAVGFSIYTVNTPSQLVPSAVSDNASDYYPRHPSVAISGNAPMTGTYLPGGQSSLQPGTAVLDNAADLSDYYPRHPSIAISSNAPMTGTYLPGGQSLLQPGNAVSVNAADLSDYYLRHSGSTDAIEVFASD